MIITIKADLRPVQRAMINLGAKQVPFANSLALNLLARGAAADERVQIDKTFESPTPFTENALRIEVATKSRPLAVIAVKDIQAQYLAPYVRGGQRFLGTKRGMLTPIAGNIGLNQFGNLPRAKLQSLKSKPNIYIGPVKTRSGNVINGVWQRPAAKRPSSKARTAAGAAAQRAPLKLLIRFTDTTDAPKRLPFADRVRAFVRKNAATAYTAAMRRAMATARR